MLLFIFRTKTKISMSMEHLSNDDYHAETELLLETCPNVTFLRKIPVWNAAMRVNQTSAVRNRSLLKSNSISDLQHRTE
jgi:hypothetical protein